MVMVSALSPPPLIMHLCEGITFSRVLMLVGQYTTHPQAHDIK